jgi:hypothetical protein
LFILPERVLLARPFHLPLFHFPLQGGQLVRDPSEQRLVLRDLTLPLRLVLAAFLISVGVGYCSALVQLHFQGGTSPGEMLPGPREVERTYHGSNEQPMSTLERLLEAESGPFNGTGSMRPAFTEKSAGWKRATRGRNEAQLEHLRQEREGERLALLAWIRAGASSDPYKQDDFSLPEALAAQACTAEYILRDEGGPARVKIQSLINERCVRCHEAQGDGEETGARKYPLDTYDRLKPYLQVRTTTAMSLPKLAQTTHVHLLGFAMLYGLTGAIFCLTSYPGWLRALIGPLPLVAQMADISCWWLGRIDPTFAHAILFTGGLVAVGLFVQIGGSLLNLFGRTGKVVICLLALSALIGGYLVRERIVQPYLEKEKAESTAPA